MCCLHILVIWSLFSSPHPHTLFTRLILIFIFLITSFRYHITPHLISPSIKPYLDYHPSPFSPHITEHNASQLTHHHINTMTISHSPADDGRKNSSESSCYAYIYCYFFTCLPSCINLSNTFYRLYRSKKCF